MIVSWIATILWLALCGSSASPLTTFKPENLKIRFRNKGSALQESVHLLKHNFIHRHLYKSVSWKKLEAAVVQQNSTTQAMTSMVESLNDTYTRYIPERAMSARNNKVRGLAVGAGFTVKRKWNLPGFTPVGNATPQQPKHYRPCGLNTLELRLTQMCILAAPVALWTCRAKVVAHPIASAVVAAASAVGLQWCARPHIHPLMVAQVNRDSAVDRVLHVGDQLLTVGGQDVSRMPSRAVQDLLDQGQYGDTVNITIARKHSLNSSVQMVRAQVFRAERNVPVHERIVSKMREMLFRRPPPQVDEPALPSAQLLGPLPEGRAEVRVCFAREYVPVSSVDASILSLRNNPNAGIGLLRIREFSDKTYHQVCTALIDLHEQMNLRHNRSVDGVVFDLRGNSGGAVVPALDIAAMFLPKDAVLMKMRANQRTETHRSTNRSPDVVTALLLLVDGRTASASEILVEALCDNRRAASLGTRTVGKNVAQAIMTLSDGSGISFTVRENLSPSGSYMGNGHTPTIELPSGHELSVENIHFNATTREFSYTLNNARRWLFV